MFSYFVIFFFALFFIFWWRELLFFVHCLFTAFIFKQKKMVRWCFSHFRESKKRRILFCLMLILNPSSINPLKMFIVSEFRKLIMSVKKTIILRTAVKWQIWRNWTIASNIINNHINVNLFFPRRLLLYATGTLNKLRSDVVYFSHLSSFIFGKYYFLISI